MRHANLCAIILIKHWNIHSYRNIASPLDASLLVSQHSSIMKTHRVFYTPRRLRMNYWRGII